VTRQPDRINRGSFCLVSGTFLKFLLSYCGYLYCMVIRIFAPGHQTVRPQLLSGVGGGWGTVLLGFRALDLGKSFGESFDHHF
jgi:hypothetical protein